MTQMEQLHSVLQLHYDIKTIAAKQMDTHKPDLAPSHDNREIWDAFRMRKVSGPGFLAPEADLQFLHLGMFGERLAAATYNWMRQLRWPDSDVGPLDKKVGISWVELALSWVHTVGVYLPIIRQDALKQKYLFWPGNDNNLTDHGGSFTEQGNMLQKLVENTCAPIPEKVWPPTVRKKVSSLYVLGGGKYHQGLTIRPEVPCQDLMMATLDKVLRQGQGTLLSAPKLGFTQTSATLEGTYADRHKRSASGMYHVRVARKARGI